MRTTTMRAPVSDDATPTPAELVERAMHGDRQAWEQLVDLYSGLVWAVTRHFRLSDADAADVTQTTWLRLLEHIDRLNDASRVGPWLATTARRECLRTVAQRRRVVPTDDETQFERLDGTDAGLDASMLAAERCETVNAALARLPQRWREIMTLLTSDPPTPYEEISARLGVPIGSIGPTRRRCLRRLEVLLEG
jgi:RNA polymerase sigma factor (sigma-70 family)